MLALEIFVVAVLTILNGLFALSELAVVSSRRSRLQTMANQGVPGATTALALAGDPGKFLSAVQIGITLIGVLSGAFSGSTLGVRLASWLADIGLPSAYADPIGIGVVAVRPASGGEAARRHVTARAGGLDAATREAIVAEVEVVLADPAFAEVFAEGSRAEVAIAGEIVGTSGGRIDVSGRIDRLAVGPSEVLVVDYKSDRGDGATPAHLAQLALYRRLLGEMFPGRAIRCALLWTAIPRLEEIAAERLDAAARRLGIGREAR